MTWSLTARWLVRSGLIGLTAAAWGAGSGCSSDEPEEGVAGSAGSAGASGSGGAAGASSSGGNAGSAGAAGSSGASGSAGSSSDSDAGLPEPVGLCNAIIVDHGLPTFQHLAPCSEVSFDTNPPSGGNHYAVWAAFQTYDFPVPPGFIVHSLEHGAVAFWYNCPDGCADEVEEVQDFIDALPEDPLCVGEATARRVILVPNPELESRWAASAWGWTLNAECFDEQVFGDFYEARSGLGREALCANGNVITEQTCP
jgi:hypothetical protein